MKLLLGLPEFTSGVDVNVRSWPFGRLPVVPGSRDLKDGFSRLPTCKASDSTEPLRHHGAPVATELARRVHRCLQSQERVHRFRNKGRPCLYRRPRPRLAGGGASITVPQQENQSDDQSQCHVSVHRRRAIRPCVLPRDAYADGETATRRGMSVLHGGQGHRRRCAGRRPGLRGQV
ncbi:hypothetical protein I35_2087 [Burkholderia cenocepacia H111]|nr:hypothetical protein I35_2087 [Burkholderia cenocepacia H111]